LIPALLTLLITLLCALQGPLPIFIFWQLHLGSHTLAIAAISYHNTVMQQ
jgi:hypothetical protein